MIKDDDDINKVDFSCHYDERGKKTCTKTPIISEKYVKETECQKCREMTETEIAEGSKL